MTWWYLITAIAVEIVATLSLKRAAGGGKPWYLLAGAGYALAFVLLDLTLRAGMPVGIAYGIWVATGIAVIALISKPLFQEPLTPTMLCGVALIVVGVLAIELGGAH